MYDAELVINARGFSSLQGSMQRPKRPVRVTSTAKLGGLLINGRGGFLLLGSHVLLLRVASRLDGSRAETPDRWSKAD